jgi:hypothetical protein
VQIAAWVSVSNPSDPFKPELRSFCLKEEHIFPGLQVTIHTTAESRQVITLVGGGLEIVREKSILQGMKSYK